MTIFDKELRIPLQARMKYYRNDIGEIEVESLKLVSGKPVMKLRLNKRKPVTTKNFKKEIILTIDRAYELANKAEQKEMDVELRRARKLINSLK